MFEQIVTITALVGLGVLVGLGATWLRTRLWGGRSVAREVKRFFGSDAGAFDIVTRSFNLVDLPNIHVAIERYTRERNGKARAVGYVSPFEGIGTSLRQLLRASLLGRITVGPVQYRELDTDVDESIRCLENGLHLLEAAEGRVLAHIAANPMRGPKVELEVMADPEALAAGFVESIRQHARESSIYRGKVVSLECDAESWGARGCAQVRFHSLPETSRDDIILPEATMGLIERNTVGFLEHADALRRSGRSLKRGLLFHGKPGTGKTYTAKWLAQALPGVTVILMSGEHLWLIKECCQMARMLAPSLVIMEDVDLIASQRDESRHPMYQVSLHQLLNEMDGLGPDAEVIFILTTNRPDAIEPAIAARPGRIDQAIEFPLPDDDCRRRLFELYGRGLELELTKLDRFIAKTEGASPAFIEELMRKAALVAAEEASSDEEPLCVRDSYVDTALRELVLDGGELTRTLLGFEADHAGSGAKPID